MTALGPYASFIVASYALAALVIIALLAWVLIDHALLKSRLAALEARGIRRRSEKTTPEMPSGATQP